MYSPVPGVVTVVATVLAGVQGDSFTRHRVTVVVPGRPVSVPLEVPSKLRSTKTLPEIGLTGVSPKLYSVPAATGASAGAAPGVQVMFCTLLVGVSAVPLFTPVVPAAGANAPAVVVPLVSVGYFAVTDDWSSTMK